MRSTTKSARYGTTSVRDSTARHDNADAPHGAPPMKKKFWRCDPEDPASGVVTDEKGIPLYWLDHRQDEPETADAETPWTKTSPPEVPGRSPGNEPNPGKLRGPSGRFGFRRRRDRKEGQEPKE